MTLQELPPSSTVPGPSGINRIVRRFSAPAAVDVAAEPTPEPRLRLDDWLFGRNPDKPAAAARTPNRGPKGGVVPVATARIADALPGITPEQLRQERARAGLSQRAAARLCQLSRSTYAGYEDGSRHNPNTATGLYLALTRQPSGVATPVRVSVPPPVRPLGADTSTRQTCRVCRVDQPLAAFGRSRSYATGYRTECQACVRRRKAHGARVCAWCGGEIPKRRAGDCCSRACLCLSVGLRPDLNPDRITSNTCDAVMASARARQ